MSCDTSKFVLGASAAEMIYDDLIYKLTWEDVIQVAVQKDIPLDLTPDEMHVFRKCLESGLSCWSEVIELALRAAISERSG